MVCAVAPIRRNSDVLGGHTHLRLNDRASRALADAEVARRMANLGVEARSMTPEQFAEFVRVESGRWADIIRRSGAKVE